VTAVLSECGRYRYTLERDLAPNLFAAGPEAVLFVMLNPSTADARVDDATIRRCVAFARAWGHTRLLVGNLFALRSTDPAALLVDDDPENDRHLLALADRADLIVCAWGTHGALRGRSDEVTALLPAAKLHHLGLTLDSEPRHPLYLPGRLHPEPFR
jgi:hypothetical protein